MNFADFKDRFFLMEGRVFVFDSKNKIAFHFSVLKGKYGDLFEKWVKCPDRKILSAEDANTFFDGITDKAAVVEGNHKKTIDVGKMDQCEYLEMIQMLYEINSRVLGRHTPFRLNGLGTVKQPAHIQMGGVYWRLAKLKQIVDKNLENFETKQHSEFIRLTHKF